MRHQGVSSNGGQRAVPRMRVQDASTKAPPGARGLFAVASVRGFESPSGTGPPRAHAGW